MYASHDQLVRITVVVWNVCVSCIADLAVIVVPSTKSVRKRHGAIERSGPACRLSAPGVTVNHLD
jgi:hypothetical protein